MKGRFFILLPILIYIGYLLHGITAYLPIIYVLVLIIIGIVTTMIIHGHDTYLDKAYHEQEKYINTFFKDDEIDSVNKSITSSYNSRKTMPYTSDNDYHARDYYKALDYKKIWKNDKNLFVKVYLIPYFIVTFSISGVNKFLNYLDKHLTV